MGKFYSRFEAEQALRRLNGNKPLGFIFSRSAKKCPVCQELESQEILDEWGYCVRCDHIRADV